MNTSHPLASRRHALGAALLGTLAAALPASPSRATGLAPNVKQRLRATLDTLAAGGRFSGSVLVSERGLPLLARSMGMANLEWQVPNTLDTRFRIGSVTKQFTAAAVLLLQEDGKLGLDDPVSRHLSGLPPAWQAITIRQLLHHRSGLPNFTARPDYRQRQRELTSPAGVLALQRELPLDFAPGTQAAYSNTGYVLLGALIEAVSTLPYARFVDDRLLRPLGLADTAAETHRGLMPRRAAGYVPDADRTLVNADFIDPSVPHAAGVLISTVGDLDRWQRALHGGRLLRPESRAAMTQPATPAVPGDGGFGMGLMIGGSPAQPEFSHGGGIDGFSAFLAWLPAHEVSIAVLSNVEQAPSGPLANALAAPFREPPRYDTAPIHLRGSMNGWGLRDRLAAAGAGFWQADIELPAGEHEFKLATEDWRTLDLGVGLDSEDPGVRPGRSVALGTSGANLRLRTVQPGRWRFTLDVRDPRSPRLRVDPLR